jgi:superfamily I DNA and/or RNA helicase
MILHLQQTSCAKGAQGEEPLKVVVITFYAQQVQALIQTQMHRRPLGTKGLMASVHTVDSFQGSEADVVFVSFVRSNERSNVGFVADYRRMNVALTRAKHALVMVGDASTMRNSDSRDLQCLMADARARKCVISEADVRHQL